MVGNVTWNSYNVADSDVARVDDSGGEVLRGVALQLGEVMRSRPGMGSEFDYRLRNEVDFINNRR